MLRTALCQNSSTAAYTALDPSTGLLITPVLIQPQQNVLRFTPKLQPNGIYNAAKTFIGTRLQLRSTALGGGGHVQQ